MLSSYYALFGAALGTLAFAVFVILGKKKDPSRRRSLSFNSIAMIQGAFPPEANVAPPIINVLVLFEKAPSVEKLKEAALQVRVEVLSQK